MTCSKDGARRTDRRDFLSQVSAAAASGLLLREAAAGTDSPPTSLPTIALGPHRISRLIVGANLKLLNSGYDWARENVPLRFRVPVCRLDLKVRVAGKSEDLPVNLETVLIEPDEERLCLTWRGALPCDKKALKVEEIAVGLQALDFAGGTA